MFEIQRVGIDYQQTAFIVLYPLFVMAVEARKILQADGLLVVAAALLDL